MASQNAYTSPLNSEDVQQGAILWLPRYIDILSKDPSAQPVLNLTFPYSIPSERFYNHPILILSRPVECPESIHFVLLTSFGGQSLTQRHPANRHRIWNNYFPLAPTCDHPWHPMLTFEGGAPNMTGGYVKISEVYEMPWCLAGRYWRTDPAGPNGTLLDSRSMGIVLKTVEDRSMWKPGEQYRSDRSSKVGETLTTVASAIAEAAKALGSAVVKFCSRQTPIDMGSDEMAVESDGPARPLLPAIPMSAGSECDTPPLDFHASTMDLRTAKLRGFGAWLRESLHKT